MEFKRVRELKFLCIIISITAFFQLQPYFIWNNTYVKYLYIFVMLILGAFFIMDKSFKLQYKNFNLSLLAIIITIYFNYNNLGRIIVNLMFAIPLFVYLLTSSESKRKIHSYFTCIFAVALLPSIIIYGFQMFNIDISWTYLEPLNSLKTEAGLYYKQYFGAVTLINPHSSMTGNLYRLCGMFDEPGVIGTISALILVSNGYQIKKSYINKILFIGGILSFSLFFYVITIAYYFIVAILERKYKSMITGVIFLIILSTFSTGIIKNDFINKTILNRIVIVNGAFAGDNRTNDYFESKYSQFLGSSTYTVMFGMGKSTSHNDKLLEASASWKKLVIDQGFIGLTLIILFFLIATFMFNKTRGGFILLLVFIASIYQRPGVFELPYIIIYFGGLITQAGFVANNSAFEETYNDQKKLYGQMDINKLGYRYDE